MKLLIDVGNSRIKWALYDGKGLRDGHAASRHRHGVRSLAKHEWGRLEKPERVLVSNVAGAACRDEIAEWVREAWGLEAEFIRAERRAFGIANAYVEPERLGTDRWAALIAVRDLAQGAACVVDCGTAITIDVITEDGVHQGGLIIPGLTMMRRALTQNTSGIELNGDEQSVGDIALLARDTLDGVKGGTLYSVVAVIDRVVADVTTELGVSMTRVITGGDAPLILPLLSGKYRHEQDLVLKGLAVMSESRA